MDEQMTSGMTPGVNVPPTWRYGLYEKVLAGRGAKAGVSPQEYQAVGWSDFKAQKDPTYTRGNPSLR